LGSAKGVDAGDDSFDSEDVAEGVDACFDRFHDEVAKAYSLRIRKQRSEGAMKEKKIRPFSKRAC